MLFIQRPETDPYYNLAAEEYLLKSATADTFMIWRNEPSVIIGKHQNALKEINQSFIEKNNLPVIRRITGGGTVYQDRGNINFSFIFTNRKENLIDFREFTQPVIRFLQSLGLEAAFEGKNNIAVDGMKVSGNSAHLYRNKVLYHGTLLFSSDLNMLERAIAGREDLFKDKAVSSIRANVSNIHDLLTEKISIEIFTSLFQQFIFNFYEEVLPEDLSEIDKMNIIKLADEKYRSYEWNFGYSPDYEFNAEWEMEYGKCRVYISVKQGLIIQVEINAPQSYSSIINSIEKQIIGAFHEKKSISERLIKNTYLNENEKQIMNQFILHLF